MPGCLISKCVYDVLIVSESDHLPIVCSFESLSKEKSRKTKIRQLKSANSRRFQGAISCISWDEVLEEKENASVAFDKLLNLLFPVYNSCCPIRIVRKGKKEPREPLINVAIIENIEERNKLYRMYLEFNM